MIPGSLAGTGLLRTGGAAAGFYEYQIEQSVRLDRASSSYFSQSMPSGAGGSSNWTGSLWFKRGLISYDYAGLFGSGSGYMRTRINSDDTFQFQTQTNFASSLKVRDTSSWYHIVINSQDTNNCLLYLNGVNQTSDLTKSSVAGMVSWFQGGQPVWLGNDNVGTAHFDGYFAEVHLVYGLNKAASDFGEFKNGVWVPKEYTGGHGTYGAYLKFEDASDLGNDSSGNNNDWTANNMGADHQVTDSPTFGG
jgi:hypothetical protein